MKPVRSRLVAALFAACLGLAAGAPTAAQPALFDPSALESGCIRGQCLAATRASLSQLEVHRLPEAELNSQLGVIAAILYEAARQAPPEAQGQIAQALLLLARISTDETQRRSLLLLARQVADGEIDLFDLQTPFAASPA